MRRDLRAGRETDHLTKLVRRQLGEHGDVEVACVGDAALARIARVAGRAGVLGLGADVQDGQARLT